MDLNNLEGKLNKENLKDFSGKKGTKKKILGGVIVILLAALGMEVTNNDWDLGSILNGNSVSESKVKRDKEGNIVTDGTGKETDEYNCNDFSTQTEAQKFFTNAGGKSEDTNNLDGDNDGRACEDLPA